MFIVRIKARNKTDPWFSITVFCSITVVVFILFPLFEMLTQPSFRDLREAVQDLDVIRSILLSIYTSGLAAVILFIVGTPFADILARKEFSEKRFVESIVDIPIMIPHPVVGIAILGVVGKNHWIGLVMHYVGIQIMVTNTGIVVALTFCRSPVLCEHSKGLF
ncbi:MAG: hypothetical protein SWO11_00255 [Thermodesulfobacteriota bacterium]|nr:hypothetical protein [Thermodesulfobacteriota bacterium]